MTFVWLWNMIFSYYQNFSEYFHGPGLVFYFYSFNWKDLLNSTIFQIQDRLICLIFPQKKLLNSFPQYTEQ